MKKYEGYYNTFEEAVKCKSLLQLKEHIENSGGYGGNPEQCNFRDYETAWIMEYNIIGRQTAQHYFSMKDKQWHRTPNKITMYSSWQSAKQPFKVMAQWILKVLGYKQKDIGFVNKFIQERKINELYGK